MAVTLDCVYGITDYSGHLHESLLKNAYTCQAKISRECDASPSVTGATKNHSKGKSRLNVEMIKFVQAEIPTIPLKIGAFFPNLLAVRFSKVGLERVTNIDLRQFHKLKFLYLGYNKLKTLDGDLFKYTPNLEFFGVDRNEITNIGNKLLEPLKHLKAVYTLGNKCIKHIPDVTYINDASKEKIEKLKQALKQKCPPTKEMIQKEKDNADIEGYVDDEPVHPQKSMRRSSELCRLEYEYIKGQTDTHD